MLSVTSFSQSVVDITLNENVKLFVEGDIIINIHPTSEDQVKIKGFLDNSAYNQLSVKENNGAVIIKLKQTASSSNYRKDSVVLDVYIKSLLEVNAKYDASAIFKDFFVLDDVLLSASNNASISALILAEKLNITSKSKGRVMVVGEANDIEMNVTNGYVNTIQVKCKKAKVSVAANGECYVKADEVLDLKATTAGSVFYKGVAEEIIKSATTFGNIEEF